MIRPRPGQKPAWYGKFHPRGAAGGGWKTPDPVTSLVREQPTIHRSGAPSTAMSMVYFGDIQGLSREEGRRRRRNTHIYQQPLSFHPTSTHLPTYLPRLPTYLTYIVTSLGDPCKGGIQSAIPRVAQCCTGTINKTATTKVKPVDNSRGHPIRLRDRKSVV